MIEGFCHSGNSFLRSNVAPSSCEHVVNYIHRPWALRRALDADIPIALLIRSPHDVAASMYYRGQLNGNHVAYWSGLACWYLYYRYAWRYRQRITILAFEHLVDDYGTAATMLEAKTEVRFIRPPRSDHMNAFSGPRPPFRQSTIARWLNSRAQMLYRNFVDLAQQQREDAAATEKLAVPKSAQADESRLIKDEQADAPAPRE